MSYAHETIEELRSYAAGLLQALVDICSGHPIRELGIDIDKEIEHGAELGVVLDDEETASDD